MAYDELWASVWELFDELIKQQSNTVFRGKPAMPSGNWKIWIVRLSPTTCHPCFARNGKIYLSAEKPENDLPMHDHCKCFLIPMPAIEAGTATMHGLDGADWHLIKYGALPSNYVTKAVARAAGWDARSGNLADILPEKMIGGGIYKNKDGKLPSAHGRIWFEADIDYTAGYRGTTRIIYSSDGLVFVSYDHYVTFMEIVYEERR